MEEMYENIDNIKKHFDPEFLSEYLLQAQWAEMVELKKIIAELSERKGAPLSLLDIGIGNARFPKHLYGIKEIWEKIGSYEGIDISEKCVEISQEVIKEYKLEDKVTVHKMDAVNLNLSKKKYDLIIATWFTAGNLYPSDFSFETNSSGKLKERTDLSKNEKFDKIFRSAYNLLDAGGEIVLGTAYIDNDSTRKKQEDFYKKCGMTIITDNKDSFTATKEGYWSQRFTKKRIKDYFEWVPAEKIKFVELDTYRYAMLVRIKR